MRETHGRVVKVEDARREIVEQGVRERGLVAFGGGERRGGEEHERDERGEGARECRHGGTARGPQRPRAQSHWLCGYLCGERSRRSRCACSWRQATRNAGQSEARSKRGKPQPVPPRPRLSCAPSLPDNTSLRVVLRLSGLLVEQLASRRLLLTCLTVTAPLLPDDISSSRESSVAVVLSPAQRTPPAGNDDTSQCMACVTGHPSPPIRLGPVLVSRPAALAKSFSLCLRSGVRAWTGDARP